MNTREQHCTHPECDFCDCDWCRFLRAYVAPDFAPENCSDCNAPTNNAEGGRCAACSAQ